MTNEVKELAAKIFLTQTARLPQYETPTSMKQCESMVAASIAYAEVFIAACEPKPKSMAMADSGYDCFERGDNE